MMIVLVCNIQDPASVNIAEALLQLMSAESELAPPSPRIRQRLLLREGVELWKVCEDLVFADCLDALAPSPGMDHFVMLSRHEARARLPSLLVHAHGNWTDEAPLGGRPRDLGVCAPLLEKLILRELAELVGELGEEWRFGLEATHHGPHLDSPAVFVEIGSTPEHWRDRRAARVLAESLVAALEAYDPSAAKEAPFIVGVGGPHYAPTFTRIALETRLAVGHILPNYVVDVVDLEMIDRAIERCLGRFEAVVLDWKGLKAAQRERIINYLSSRGLRALKSKEVLG